MMQHTKEPWASFDSCDIVTLRGTGKRHLGGFNKVEDGVRTVACVNACAGLNPKEIPELVAACEEWSKWEHRSGMSISTQENCSQPICRALKALKEKP